MDRQELKGTQEQIMPSLNNKKDDQNMTLIILLSFFKRFVEPGLFELAFFEPDTVASSYFRLAM